MNTVLRALALTALLAVAHGAAFTQQEEVVDALKARIAKSVALAKHGDDFDSSSDSSSAVVRGRELAESSTCPSMIAVYSCGLSTTQATCVADMKCTWTAATGTCAVSVATTASLANRINDQDVVAAIAVTALACAFTTTPASCTANNTCTYVNATTTPKADASCSMSNAGMLEALNGVDPVLKMYIEMGTICAVASDKCAAIKQCTSDAATKLCSVDNKYLIVTTAKTCPSSVTVMSKLSSNLGFSPAQIEAYGKEMGMPVTAEFKAALSVPAPAASGAASSNLASIAAAAAAAAVLFM